MVWDRKSGAGSSFKQVIFALVEKWNLHSSAKLLAMLSAAGKFNRELSTM